MAYNSKDTNNYESVSLTSIDQIDQDTPIRVGYQYTIKNVFNGLNKIIKAIITKFNIMEDERGTISIPTIAAGVTQSLSITGLKRRHTHGTFIVHNADDITKMGTNYTTFPNLWVANRRLIGCTYTYRIGTSQTATYTTPSFPITNNSGLSISAEHTSDNTITITLDNSAGSSDVPSNTYKISYELY